MNMMLATKADHPSHVPANVVRDFDFIYPQLGTGERDLHLAYKKLQDDLPPIFWTPHHGGHWVFANADDIELAANDWKRFSMRGHSIPMNITPNVPLELDPPLHGPVRAMLSPFFSPRVVKDLSVSALEITTELLDDIVSRGRCDFTNDFARQLPIVLFLRMVDLPRADREELLPLAEVRVRGKTALERDAAKVKILGYLKNVISERRAVKTDDLLSKMLHGKVNGEPLSNEMSENLVAQLMFAGLDTVASLLGFTARYLAMNADFRRQLVADPSLIPVAFDELARRHATIVMARLITEDFEHKGLKFRKGEQVLLPYPFHSLDESRYEDPLKVDIYRKNAPDHIGFGLGPHRCPGSVLARAETRIFMQEWLKRIPEFEIDPDDEVMIEGGRVCAVTRLPLRWSV